MRAVAVITSVLCAFAGVTVAAAGHGQKPVFAGDIRKLEAQVLATLNGARMQPHRYGETLITYRGYFQAHTVVMPSEHIDIETQEGAVPVDDAIDYLTTHAALKAYEPSETLRLAAADLLAEQRDVGTTGHFGSDGSSPGDRAARHGGGRDVAEVIAYGAADAEDVIRQLVIDDGVLDRGHRALLFSDHLRYAGVACGPHPEFGTMCVIDLADTAEGRSFGSLRRVQMAGLSGRR